MNSNDKIALIEDCMDFEGGSLKLEDKLADYEEWDSLSVLSVIALVNEKYNKTLTGEELKRAKTVSDIVKLIG